MSRERTLLVASLLAALAVRVVLALTTDVYADEAYYWVWSRHLDWSYFDHPPLVAWCIAALGIRGAGLACGLLTTLGVYLTGRALYRDDGTALWAATVWSATPAATLLGTLAVPDAPLLAAWAFALWGLARGTWWLVGLGWGLAMLGKYNGILLAVPVLVAFWGRWRELLGAAVLAGLLASPVVAWNAAHDWEGFRFQLNHGLGGGGGLGTFLEFLGGQLGMAGLVLVPLGLGWMAWGRTSTGATPAGPRHDWALRAAAAVPLLFFGYASFRARGEANWAAAAWMAASLGVAGLWTASRPRWATLLGGLVPTLLLGAFLAFPPHVARGLPAVRRLHGWSPLRALARERVPVFTSSYQLSSEVALYAGLEVGTVGGRRSQFDLWPAPRVAPGGTALWVCEGGLLDWGDEPPPEALAQRFERVESVLLPDFRRVGQNHSFCLYRLEGYRGP